MKKSDKERILDFMRTFYASPAIHTDGSEEIFNSDIDACLSDSPYIEGFVFEHDSLIVGYAMIAKSYSTEFGKPCIWIEDLYVEKEYRGKGIGKEFLRYIDTRHPDCILRLEAESENHNAIAVYEKSGFQVLPYLEMIKLRK